MALAQGIWRARLAGSVRWLPPADRGAEALDLIDGCRVHIANESDCLIRHGERWRRDATRALVELGVKPPQEDGF
jgi:hypothetical protein